MSETMEVPEAPALLRQWAEDSWPVAGRRGREQIREVLLITAEVTAAKIVELRELLLSAMLRLKCEGTSMDSCLRCEISHTLTGASRHIYPNDTQPPAQT